jgi:hypothetical protein
MAKAQIAAAEILQCELLIAARRAARPELDLGAVGCAAALHVETLVGAGVAHAVVAAAAALDDEALRGAAVARPLLDLRAVGAIAAVDVEALGAALSDERRRLRRNGELGGTGVGVELFVVDAAGECQRRGRDQTRELHGVGPFPGTGGPSRWQTMHGRAARVDGRFESKRWTTDHVQHRA